MALEQELATYRRELPKMLAEHAGDYVLIHGDQVIGFWPDEDSAWEEGVERFRPGLPFMVRRVEEKEPVLYTYLDIHPRCRP